MRGLFRWAYKAKLIEHDPTAGVETPARPKTEGFKAWTEDDVSAYEQHWPIGTRQRVWLDVLLYTGLRRGDAVRLGRQHLKHGVATLTTEALSFGMIFAPSLMEFRRREGCRTSPRCEVEFDPGSPCQKPLRPP